MSRMIEADNMKCIKHGKESILTTDLESATCNRHAFIHLESSNFCSGGIYSTKEIENVRPIKGESYAKRKSNFGSGRRISGA